MEERQYSSTEPMTTQTFDANGAIATDEWMGDWTEVARTLLTSRVLDDVEEQELVPAGKVRYQFSARGHELAQILLGLRLNHAHDAATVYYRSRPFMLAAGLTVREALCGSMARTGGTSEGRDIGVVFNMPARGRAAVLPMSGDVGTQYTPAAGWAQAIRYWSETLGKEEWRGAVAVVLGGDGSVVTPGFWTALNLATTLTLPLLFLIEDNGYAISVPSTFQVPGGNISANLRSYQGLLLMDGDGADPLDAAPKIEQALGHVRAGQGPALLHLRVPRLNGHSISDNQAYKDDEQKAAEWRRDPLPHLRQFLLEHGWTEQQWDDMARDATEQVRAEVQRALKSPEPNPATVTQYLYAEAQQQTGGNGVKSSNQTALSQIEPPTDGARINMIDAIRQTLAHELRHNPRMQIFGEDVGRKGGVHGATRDLQHQFGAERVFDTSLSEEGIIGRAIGMALAGLLPATEIQFRKYADPAMEQLTDCGTIRWRTHNHFAAPMVVRIPVGFSKHTGDPWHSVSGEAILAHLAGWKVVMPAHAADAAGLLRTALRGNDPVFFLEHRALLDSAEGRRPYPGDNYSIPLGKAAVCHTGEILTVVTWGAMVPRCLEAAQGFSDAVEILDLRTITPWDHATVLESVRKTGRCLIVHEDNWTVGFGAEIAATVVQEAFEWLDAPVSRLATPDCPIPYNVGLMNALIPSVAAIRQRIEELLRY
jgi:2-oxoisovalerate dehydrogenase E1 component